MDQVLKQFTNNLPESVVFIDTTGTIVDANPCALSTFGYSAAELLGQNVNVLAAEPDGAQHQRYLEHYLETRVPKIMGVGRKVIAKHKDGRLFPVFLSVSEHTLSGTTLFVGVLRDLSEMEKTASELKTLGELVEEALSTVFILEQKRLKLRYLNRHARSILGYSQSELDALHFGQLMHADEAEAFRTACESLNQATPALTLTAQLCSKDGRCFPVDLHMHRAHYLGEAVFAVTGIPRTIEMETQRRLGAVLGTMSSYVVFMDHEFVCEFINRSDGIFSSTLIGQPFLNVVDQAQRATVARHFTNFQSGKPQSWIMPLTNATAQTTWLDCTLSAIKDDGYCLIAHDVTALKAAEEQATIAAKFATIGELAAGLAHEINNPLTIITGNLIGVRRELDCDEPSCEVVKKKVDTIQLATKRIEDVVRGFYSFSRADEDPSEQVSVSATIEETLRMISGVFANQQVAVHYEAPQHDYVILGSSGRLQQVLLNLLMNAKDAVAQRQNKNITIRLGTAQRLVFLDVLDDGPGVATEVAAKIFELFFTTKAAGLGTGFGLPISRKLVHDMNGQLTLHQTSSQGSCFRIALPLVSDASSCTTKGG